MVEGLTDENINAEMIVLDENGNPIASCDNNSQAIQNSTEYVGYDEYQCETDVFSGLEAGTYTVKYEFTLDGCEPVPTPDITVTVKPLYSIENVKIDPDTDRTIYVGEDPLTVYGLVSVPGLTNINDNPVPDILKAKYCINEVCEGDMDSWYDATFDSDNDDGYHKYKPSESLFGVVGTYTMKYGFILENNPGVEDPQHNYKEETEAITVTVKYKITEVLLEPAEDQVVNINENGSLQFTCRVKVPGLTDSNIITEAKICKDDSDCSDYIDILNDTEKCRIIDEENYGVYECTEPFAEFNKGENIRKCYFKLDNGEDGESNKVSVTGIDCLVFNNGDFNDWEDDGTTPKEWTLGADVESSDDSGALRIKSNNSDPQDILFSQFFGTDFDAEIPAGIKFKMSARKASAVAIDLTWDEGYRNTYNWNQLSNAFIFAGENQSYDFSELVPEHQMQDVTIIFGPEIDEEIWRNKEKLQIRFVGSDVDIDVDNFEFVYLGEGVCKNNIAGSVNAEMTPFESDKFYYVKKPYTFTSRVKIESGSISNTVDTPEKSIALIGVRARFCVRLKGSEQSCEEPEVFRGYLDAVISDHSDDEDPFFNGYDEYQYTGKIDREEGEYEYWFEFSSDNGNNWVSTNVESVGIRKKNQIPNSDFSEWDNDNTPTGWEICNNGGEFSKVPYNEENGQFALQVSLGKDEDADYIDDSYYYYDFYVEYGRPIFRTPDFYVDKNIKWPKSIKFQLDSDQIVTMLIAVKCYSEPKSGCDEEWNPYENSQWYWHDDYNSFTYYNNPESNPLELGEGFHDIEMVMGSLKIAEDIYHNDSSYCHMEFIYGYDTEHDRWAKFYGFEIIYPLEDGEEED